ncbi:MAG: hypothetical protein QI223_00045 [Candidatus Korarchaeota archaeon]|nr:hypothetical protein [Candidatus Korarchaeota archaeon]
MTGAAPELVEVRAFEYAGIEPTELAVGHDSLVKSLGYECYRALYASGLARRMEGVSLSKLKEVSAYPELMEAVVEAMARGGYVRLAGGRVSRFLDLTPPPETVPWVDRIMRSLRSAFEALPDLLISGAQPRLDRETRRLATLAMYDNPVARFQSALALLGMGMTDAQLIRRWADVGLIPATVLLPWSGIGMVAVDALRLIGAKIVAGVPPGDLRAARLVVSTLKAPETGRLRLVESDLESFGQKVRSSPGLVEGQADAAVLIDAVQWAGAGFEALLKSLDGVLAEEAPLFLLQALREGDSQVIGIPYALLGGSLPPTRGELEYALKLSGYRSRELIKGRGVVLLRASRRE